MISELVLQSGMDVPFPQIGLNVHQPKIREISFITEDNFFQGCSILNFSKNKLLQQDKINLENISDFEILMSIMNNKDTLAQKQSLPAKMLLALLFPNCSIVYEKDIQLIDEDLNIHLIDNNSFDNFKAILIDIFNLNSNEESIKDYNPGGQMAAKIAEKLKKGQAKKAALNNNKNKKVSLLSRYISILSVGLQKDKNELLNYTVWQLFDEFKRYQSKVENDFYYEAKRAGAKNIKEVDPWMRDLYS